MFIFLSHINQSCTSRNRFFQFSKLDQFISCKDAVFQGWLSPLFCYEIKQNLQPVEDLAETTQIQMLYARKSAFHHDSTPEVSGVQFVEELNTFYFKGASLFFWKKRSHSKDVCNTGNIMYNLLFQYSLEISKTVQYSPILQAFHLLRNCWWKLQWLQIFLNICIHTRHSCKAEETVRLHANQNVNTSAPSLCWQDKNVRTTVGTSLLHHTVMF